MASSTSRHNHFVYDENARENSTLSSASASSSKKPASGSAAATGTAVGGGYTRASVHPTPASINKQRKPLQPKTPVGAKTDFAEPISEQKHDESRMVVPVIKVDADLPMPSSSSSTSSALPTSQSEAPSVTPRKGTFGVKKLFFGTGFQRAARVKQNEQKPVEEKDEAVDAVVVVEEPIVAPTVFAAAAAAAAAAASETESQHDEVKGGSSKEKKGVRFISPTEAPAGPRAANPASLGPVVRPGSLSPQAVAGPSLTKSATAGNALAPPPPHSAFKPLLAAPDRENNAEIEMQTPMPGASTKPRVLYRQSPARVHSPGIPRSALAAPENALKQPAFGAGLPEIDQTPTLNKGKRRKPLLVERENADENEKGIEPMADEREEAAPQIAHRSQHESVATGGGALTAGRTAGTSKRAGGTSAPPPAASADGDGSDGAPPPTAKPGDTLIVRGRKLTVLEKIGSGGYSTVYKVLDQETFEIFACKDVYKHRSDTAAFMNEIQILTRIVREKRNNPEVRNTLLQLISYEETPTRGLVLFEHGELDLTRIQQRFLNQREPSSPLLMGISHLRVYWEQMLKCVAQLHALKIVHCDLKPANFVLVKGRVKLIDFGIAIDETQSPVPHSKGTLSYLPPELCSQILRREKVDVPRLSRDIWALGCILFEFAFGRTPFKKKGIDDAEESKRDILTTVADPHHVVPFPENSKVFASLQNCINVCLRYIPETRPPAALLLKHQFLTSVDEGGQ